MSLPNDYFDYLVRQEQHKDLIRQAEQARLIAALEAQHAGNYRELIHQLGIQLEKVGQRLQNYAAPSPPRLAEKTK